MKLFSKWLSTGLCVATLAGLTACNDDDSNVYVDVDGQPPVMDLGDTQAWIEGGRDFVVRGTLTDNDGIATVDIVCHNLLVNKTIDLIAINKGEAPTTYELSYRIQTKNNIPEADNYVVDVTVTDVGGRKTTTQIPVRLDGDITAPVFTVAPDAEMGVLTKPGESTSFDLEFSLSDNISIDYVDVLVEERVAADTRSRADEDEEGYVYVALDGYPKHFEVNAKTFNYSEPISFPDDSARVLRATITTCDKEANEAAHITEMVSMITLKPLTPDFKLWLCDVEDQADLSSDVFGVPMLIDNIGEYEYAARYFNEKSGTGVFFVGQKGSFGPICFGPSKEDKNVLGDAFKDVDRIILDQANVYYLIKFNTLDRNYEVSTYTIDEAIDPIMHMHYGADDMNTWWETNNMDDIWWQKFVIGPAGDPGSVEGNEMEQDPNNKHIYIKEDWKLDAGQMNFAIQAWHSHGWWNFESWRVDNSEDPDKFMYYGNYHPTTPHYESNDDYFNWKYTDEFGGEGYMEYAYPNNPVFDLSKWGDESYRKNYVPDNWAKPTVKEAGTYKLILDAHLERAKLVPQK